MAMDGHTWHTRSYVPTGRMQNDTSLCMYISSWVAADTQRRPPAAAVVLLHAVNWTSDDGRQIGSPLYTTVHMLRVKHRS
eukprot:1847423-Prymnesium_polylepis.1